MTGAWTRLLHQERRPSPGATDLTGESMTLADPERQALLRERDLLESICHVAERGGQRLPRWLLDLVLTGGAVPVPRREAGPAHPAPFPRTDPAGGRP